MRTPPSWALVCSTSTRATEPISYILWDPAQLFLVQANLLFRHFFETQGAQQIVVPGLHVHGDLVFGI